MGSSADLFGSNVKLLSLQNDPPAVPNEQDLLAAVIAKVGPFADEEKLLYHIRVSAGKVHWAVNSYLRSILASPAPTREDFDSKPCQAQRLPAAGHCLIAATVNQDGQILADPPHTAAVPGPAASSQPTTDAAQQCQWDLAGTHSNSPCSSSEAAAAPTAAAVSAATSSALILQSLPANVIDNVLALLDLQSLVHAASSCKALHKAAQSERIWRQLFGQRWGPVIFPTSKYNNSRSCKNTGSQQAAAQETAISRSAAAAAGQVQIHRADAHSADVLHSGRAEPKSAAPVTAGNAAAAADLGSAGSNSNTAFVSRWTGSSICPGLNTSSSATERAPTAEVSVVAAKSPASAGIPDFGAGLRHRVSSDQAENSSCSCSSCASLPAVAHCGSWQLQYKKQHSYQAARKCPKCGAATVVPVVYGFPSGPLLAGMAEKRLQLGGDHLIDSCHVWACSSCRSCYRFYPYCDVQRWLQDDEAQLRLDQARSAAGRGSRRQTAAVAEGDDVDGVRHQQGGVADGEGGLGVDGVRAGAMGFPKYTYEL